MLNGFIFMSTKFKLLYYQITGLESVFFLQPAKSHHRRRENNNQYARTSIIPLINNIYRKPLNKQNSFRLIKNLQYRKRKYSNCIFMCSLITKRN